MKIEKEKERYSGKRSGLCFSSSRKKTISVKDTLGNFPKPMFPGGIMGLPDD